MTVMPKSILNKKIKELQEITNSIEKLEITDEWKGRFTTLIVYERSYKELNESKVLQMINISNVNSPAIKLLADRVKKVGLDTLETLSVQIHNEKQRLKAVQLIIELGVKAAQRDIDLIISDNQSKED